MALPGLALGTGAALAPAGGGTRIDTKTYRSISIK